MRDDFLIFGSPLIGDAEIAEVVDSLKSGWVGTGPKVRRFERMLEDYTGAAHVRCVSSCSAAMLLALRAHAIGPGDEVIVPTMTFVATANAVEHVGATPVLVDCEPGTKQIDLEAADAAVTERTRAIMPVHFAGRPLDMHRLAQLRDRHGLVVIEDAAHALGASYAGRRIGNHGNVAAFSFYVTKNVTTIEGGALTTDDPAIAVAVERLALHGLSQGAWQRFSDEGFKHYEAVTPGFKFNMTDVEAAVGLHQLPRLDQWICRRAELWERYDEELRDLPLELPPEPDADTLHARHLYTVELDETATVSRDEILNRLTKLRIGVGVHYQAVHMHRYYRERYGLEPHRFPVATRISANTISLPLSPKLTDADQADVISAVWQSV